MFLYKPMALKEGSIGTLKKKKTTNKTKTKTKNQKTDFSSLTSQISNSDSLRRAIVNIYKYP